MVTVVWVGGWVGGCAGGGVARTGGPMLHAPESHEVPALCLVATAVCSASCPAADKPPAWRPCAAPCPCLQVTTLENGIRILQEEVQSRRVT